MNYLLSQRKIAELSYYPTIVFFFCLIFDPNEAWLGLKTELFIILLLIVLLNITFFKNSFPKNMYAFVFLFILIPFISILLNLFLRNNVPIGYLVLIKGYLFILFIFILSMNNRDYIKDFAFLLNVLSIIVCFIGIIVLFQPSTFFPIRSFFEAIKFGDFGIRNFSGNSILSFSIYTLPLLTLAISYNYYIYKKSNYFFYKMISIVLISSNCAALFLSGSRANIIGCVFLLSILILMFENKRIKLTFISFVSLFVIIFLGDIYYLVANSLSFSEPSNAIKLASMLDYKDIFSDPTVFLFGQGLGSAAEWNFRGLTYLDQSFITELTYFEIFRFFGIFFGLVIIYLMLYPILLVKKITNNEYKKYYLILLCGYTIFLFQSFFNPIYFNSIGISFLALMISTNYYLSKKIQ